MTDSAAFSATFSDWKVVKTRRVVQIVFEVPLESAGDAYNVLGGMPQVDREQWFAIAPLVGVAVAAKAKPNHTVMTAGRLCTDPMFQEYLKREYPRVFDETYHHDQKHSDHAAEIVRQVLQISSRKELATDQSAANAFDGMVAKYEMWKRGE